MRVPAGHITNPFGQKLMEFYEEGGSPGRLARRAKFITNIKIGDPTAGKGINDNDYLERRRIEKELAYGKNLQDSAPTSEQ